MKFNTSIYTYISHYTTKTTCIQWLWFADPYYKTTRQSEKNFTALWWKKVTWIMAAIYHFLIQTVKWINTVYS